MRQYAAIYDLLDLGENVVFHVSTRQRRIATLSTSSFQEVLNQQVFVEVVTNQELNVDRRHA